MADTIISSPRRVRRSATLNSPLQILTRFTVDDYPLGYPSVAQYISTDIDGRIYRRFSYLRNRLLLRRQDELVCLEDKLNKIDDEESRGDDVAKYRLISWRYDEEDPADCKRKPVLDDIENVLREYDDLLQREHEIMSIKTAGKKLHKGIFDFIINGRLEEGEKLKHLCLEEYQYLYRRDDFLILGTQEDAWLGTHVESIKSFMPKKLRDVSIYSSGQQIPDRLLNVNLKTWSETS
jgi:hypothetical protein